MAGTSSGICLDARDERAADQPKRLEPLAVIGPDVAVAYRKIEITLSDGTSIKIGHDVSLMTLRRVITVLRG